MFFVLDIRYCSENSFKITLFIMFKISENAVPFIILITRQLHSDAYIFYFFIEYVFFKITVISFIRKLINSIFRIIGDRQFFQFGLTFHRNI